MRCYINIAVAIAMKTLAVCGAVTASDGVIGTDVRGYPDEKMKE